MNKLSLSAVIFMVIILLPGCGRNPEQAKKYSEMISNCDSLISQADLIIQYRRNQSDSLNAINAKFQNKALRSKPSRLEQEILKTAEIASNIETIKRHLEAIKIFAAVGEKANKRIVFFKRKYINYSTSIQIHDENVMIREITNGLSTEQYISRNMPAILK